MELGRGDGVTLTPLDLRAALRTLLNVTVVPPCAPIWDAALRVVTTLVHMIPVLRLDWTATRENAAEVVARLSPSGRVATR